MYWRDWSSDVCSSDLVRVRPRGRRGSDGHPVRGHSRRAGFRPAAGGTRRRDPARAARGERLTDQDRKGVLQGMSVDLGGRLIIKKQKGMRLRILYKTT